MTRDSQRQEGRPRAYRTRRAFDGQKVLTGGVTVRVRGRTIEGVDAGNVVLPAEYHLLDLPDATLVPGLIDTHVHLCADGGPGALARDPERTSEQREAVIRESLRRHLQAGVTAVRDLGDHHWAVVDRPVREDEPRVVASGPPITTPGGHCWTMGGQARGKADFRTAVKERAERGVSIVKLVVSGGAMTAGSDLLSLQYQPEEVAFLVTQAHRAGLPVTAHAHSLAAVQVCVAAGVDGIEHCTCLTGKGLSTPPDLIEALAAQAIQVCPTLGRVPGSRPSPQAIEVSERTGLTLEGRFAQVAELRRGGVLVISGSDAGIHPGKPHGILPHAVSELVKSGFTAIHALGSATSGAALACGLSARTGRLRAGLDADLLIVDGDPTERISDLTRVRAVVLRGREVQLRDVPLRGESPR